jgi:hypothetical protein
MPPAEAAVQENQDNSGGRGNLKEAQMAGLRVTRDDDILPPEGKSERSIVEGRDLEAEPRMFAEFLLNTLLIAYAASYWHRQ